MVSLVTYYYFSFFWMANFRSNSFNIGCLSSFRRFGRVYWMLAEDNFMSLGINKNLFLVFNAFYVCCGFSFFNYCVKYIHKRTITSLVTSRKKIDWKRFWFGFFTWGILVAVLTFIGIF